MLIHFDHWNQRYDEWIDMDSDRLRPGTRRSDRAGVLRHGETVRPVVVVDCTAEFPAPPARCHDSAVLCAVCCACVGVCVNVCVPSLR